MENCVVVIPTFSQYLDVCGIFWELFQLNWGDCPYKIVMSVIGENVSINGLDTVYAGEKGYLSNCICAVTEKYVADYYICLLGDAMICNHVDTNEVNQLLQELKRDKISYCKIKPTKIVGKNLYRKIKKGEAYIYTFAAFIANRGFIDKEINGKSDFEFEMEWYQSCLNGKDDAEDIRIMNKDVFHIVSGISKGKWERSVYRFLRCKYPQFDLSFRKRLSIMEQIKNDLYTIAETRLTVRMQHKWKSLLKKMGFHFYMYK